jgi:TPR repeat protein
MPQSYQEAAKWLRLAAEQGLDNSQNKLGLMYEVGEGVPQDYVSAHMWFNLAAAQGFPAALNRERVATRMSSLQITEAQKLARDWKPRR